jgi:hypothetical protein
MSNNVGTVVEWKTLWEQVQNSIETGKIDTPITYIHNCPLS